MKLKKIVILVAIAGTLGWQSGAQTITTNAPIYFQVLTAGEKSYTNATIIGTSPADAIVSFDGGLARVALSNLPDLYQRKFNYDPERAAEYQIEEKKKEGERRTAEAARRVAYENAVASLRGTNQIIHVISFIDERLGSAKCLVETDIGTKTVLLQNMPVSVKDFVFQMNQLRLDIGNFQDKVEGDTKAAERADALVPVVVDTHDRDDVDWVNARRIRANRMMLDAKYEAEDLQKMKDALSKMELEADKRNAVTAFPTGQSYAGFEIWECVGVR